jgi:hypothetical protein
MKAFNTVQNLLHPMLFLQGAAEERVIVKATIINSNTVFTKL